MVWKVNGNPWYKSWPVVFMILVGIIESSFAYIQAIKSFQRKSADDLSLIAFVLLLIANLIWILWGSIIKDVPILMLGVLTAGGAVLVIISIFLYSEELT